MKLDPHEHYLLIHPARSSKAPHASQDLRLSGNRAGGPGSSHRGRAGRAEDPRPQAHLRVADGGSRGEPERGEHLGRALLRLVHSRPLRPRDRGQAARIAHVARLAARGLDAALAGVRRPVVAIERVAELEQIR
jgi:hypothetical protein